MVVVVLVSVLVVGVEVVADVEVVGVVGVGSVDGGPGVALVAAERACHVPPKLLTFSPCAWPLALSPEK